MNTKIHASLCTSSTTGRSIELLGVNKTIVAAASKPSTAAGERIEVSSAVDNINSEKNIIFDCSAQDHLTDLVRQQKCECLVQDESNSEQTTIEILSELEGVSSERQAMNNTTAQVMTEAKKNKSLNLMTFIQKDEDLIAFTGVDFQLLDSITELFLKFEGKDAAKKFSNSLRDRIAMCLCKLRINISFRCLAVLFGLTRQQCVTNFEYTLVTLSVLLEKVIYWPSKEEILDSMPVHFEKFKKTRVVLDCTEIPVERFGCLNCRLKSYSHYYGCETLKILIGIAPSGLISFLSPVYGGRTSDKMITEQSKILDKLDPFSDAVMVDKGFMIEEECLQNYIEMIRPPFLKDKKQLTPKEADENKKIARARIHVERTIQRFKMFKIVNSKVQHNLLCYFDCIVKVVAALVNLKSPVLSDDRFL